MSLRRKNSTYGRAHAPTEEDFLWGNPQNVPHPYVMPNDFVAENDSHYAWEKRDNPKEAEYYESMKLRPRELAVDGLHEQAKNREL